MYKKAVFASVLIAFVCVQLATSLTCYTCTTPNDCKSPSKTTCTNATASTTSHHLGVYHQNVQNVSGLSFSCLALKYTYANNNSVVHQIHGCVHPNVYPCTLPLKPQYASWRKTRCLVCSGDKCNKNPAGKLSSSLFTVAATALGLMLAKIYA
ncbi:hypothetical protein KR222_005241 [Zaprionus bogoriensis]|nr:hypothetical protein KR222_005241 [Zaprionus bogoriensis]